MKDFLKTTGLHHGIPWTIISWALYLINPLWGINTAIFSIIGYGWKELGQAEMRGFKPFNPSTWKFRQFEWPDFITLWVMQGINIYLMKGLI